jgi:hypothetical protein
MMGDSIPLSHYAPADITDLPLSAIAGIDTNEFSYLDAANLLAFTDEQILVMSNQQVKFYREALLTRMNDIAFDEKQPQSEEVKKLTKRAEQVNAMENSAVLSLDHGGVKVGEIPANEVETAYPTSDRMPTSEKEALNLGRGGLFAPAGTPENLAEMQNRTARCAHSAKLSATDKLPVTAEEEEHWRHQETRVIVPAGVNPAPVVDAVLNAYKATVGDVPKTWGSE